MQKQISTLIGIIIIVAVAVVLFGGVFAYQYFIKFQTPIAILPVQSQQATEGWKTYKNSEYGFSFDYPSDWNIHLTDGGANVLTKQHDVDNGPGGKMVDFAMGACKLSEQSCINIKKDMDQQIQAYSSAPNTTLLIAGKIGHQWVMSGAGNYYNGVIEANDNLYIIASDFNDYFDDYGTRYPNPMSKQLKAIFDSIKFTK